LNPQVINVVTAGVVVNPPIILREIDSLVGRGIHVGNNLMLSDRAHVVCPWHIAEDQLLEGNPSAGQSIGTTLRGIGPCYRDKVGRSFAIRVGDLFRDDFAERLERIVVAKRRILDGLSSSGASEFQLDANSILKDFRGYAERLPAVCGDTTGFLLDALDAGRPILFEGAQGTMFGHRPRHVSLCDEQHSSAVGVASGAGVPPRCLDKVMGVAKAYTTRVGGDRFRPSKTTKSVRRSAKQGGEYGTTTGRPRRCGWFDAVAVRYAVRLGGIDSLCLMKLDVLSGLPEIKICVAYELDSQRLQRFPSHADDLRRVQPIYETLPGWETDVSRIRRMKDLPAPAIRYLERVSGLVQCPLEIVSVGPDREQTILAGE